MSRSSRPSPRPLRLPHLKFDCCVGRVGRVPIDLGLVVSIMVIDSVCIRLEMLVILFIAQ